MIGTRLANRYEILKEIGRGGMGVVYLARDPELERTVAIKVVTPELLSPETAQRFKREARVVAKMDHPSIVTVYDSGEHEGSLFFVMPYVEGTNLRTLLHDQSLSLGELIDLAIQVADALEYSHSRGIVHRDIKPENIMVTRNPAEGLRVRVMDFGLAVGPAHERITRTATVVGTIAYMSPEQVTGKEVDSRSDIYSFGTVLYECLVGQTPFSGEIQALVYRITHELPMAPRAVQREVDEEVEEILLKCLEKDPEKRLTGKEIALSLSRYKKKLETSGRNLTMLPTASVFGAHPQPRKAVRPFVGREKEFGALQHRLNAAVSGECQFVLVGGEAGIGKTRLLEELETLAKARSIPALHGRFVEVNHALPYQGFCEAIQEYFRAHYTLKSGEHPDFTDLSTDLTTLFPVLAECKELVRSDESLRTASEPAVRKFEDRTYIFELLARTLTRIAGGKPLILLLEDLHAANVSIEALDYIVRRLAPTPTLIVGTYRTTEVDKRHPITNLLSGFKGDKRFTLIQLGPLSPTGHRHYLEELIGASKLEDALVERFYQSTEGNPYFTYELVRSLMDSGGIVKDESGITRLSSETAISIDELPVTIQQTVAERIERLPKDLREVLSLASVLGRAFEFEHLEYLDAENEEFENAIEQLIHSGFLEEERQSRSDRLSFSSGMVRDVLYASLPRRKRRSLHKKHAEELEKKNSGRLERVYSQLFEHYVQADVPEKVIEYGFLLARKSLDAFSSDDATRVAQMVLDFLEDDPEKQLEIAEARVLLAQAQRMSGNINDALETLEGAVNIFEKQKQRERLLHSLLLGVEISWQSRKAEETWRWIGRGLDLAGILKDNSALTQLLSLAATVANLRGEYEKAQEYLEEVEKLKPSREESVEEQIQGGTLVVAMTNPCSARHPTSAGFNEEVEILSNIFETLVVSDEQGNLIPHLCERWETLNEGGLFLFVLRKDIKFHDGSRLTAETVQHSFEDSIRRSASALIPAFSSIRGVHEFLEGREQNVAGIIPLSENIIQIQLTERLPIYPALLTDPRTGIIGKPDPSERSLLGTGHFKITSIQPGSILVERNQNYWKGKYTVLDQIDFRVGLTSAEVAEGFRSGSYDLVRDLLPNDLEEILRDRRLRATIVEAPKKNIYFALLNRSSAVCQIPAIREALCGIVRSHDLVTSTLGRYATPAEGILPPSILGHDSGKRRPSLSREKATELIRSSGLPLPIRLNASVHPLLQDRYLSFLQALRQAWSDIGVEIVIQTPDIGSYNRTFLLNEGIDLMIGRWIGDYDDPDAFTYGLFHSGTGEFRTYYSSPEFDQLAEQARAENEPARRERLYRKIDLHLTDSYFFLPLFHEVDYRVSGPQVRKLTLSNNSPYVNYADVAKSETLIAAPGLKLEKGTVVVPITGDFQSLDPTATYFIWQGLVFPAVFDTLTRAAEGARIIPWLASRFVSENGGRRYRFFLRDGVRFHDGRRLTSRDVRYTFEHLLLNRENQNRWFLSPVRGAGKLLHGESQELEGLRIISSTEFVVELEQPLSFFPALLAYTALSIIPAGTDTFSRNWRESCAGTGAFRVTSFEPGRSLKVEANPDYWRPGLPKSTALEFIFNCAPQEILSGFRSGKFSVAWDLPPTDVDRLRHESESGVRFYEIPILSSHYLVLNVHREPFSDEKIRQKFFAAIDVDGLVRRNLARLAVPGNTLIPPGLLTHEPSARRRPATGGRHTGERIPVKVMFHSVYESQYGGFVQELLRSLDENGFAVEVIDRKGEYRKFNGIPDADVSLTRWLADYPDADSFMNSVLHSERGGEGPFCGSADLDALIEKGRTESEPSARQAIYRQIEELIRNRAIVLPLFYEQAYCFTRPKVEGLELNFFNPYVPYEYLWLRSSS